MNEPCRGVPPVQAPLNFTKFGDVTSIPGDYAASAAHKGWQIAGCEEGKAVRAETVKRNRLLKNSLGARSGVKAGTKDTDFGAFRAPQVVAISSMPTFSTGWQAFATLPTQVRLTR